MFTLSTYSNNIIFGSYDDYDQKSEYFLDRVNGILDPQEFYYDFIVDGEEYDSFVDAFEDRNCNGIWDDAEEVDEGNGIWDDDEQYIDKDGTGDWTVGDPLYVMSEKPDNFLVNYEEDYSNSCDYSSIHGKCPEAFIKYAYHEQDTAKTDTITLFTHYDNTDAPQFQTYHSLITSYSDVTTLTATYPDIDSIITVYSNVFIDSLPGLATDYRITKAQWFLPVMDDLGLDTVGFYDYDYHNHDQYHICYYQL